MSGHTCTSHTKYVAGCRGCQIASADYNRNRYRAVAYGRWQAPVPADTARERLTHLHAAGWSIRQIAAATGLANSTVEHISTRTTIRHETEQAVLSIHPGRPAPVSDRKLVNPIGTQRRLRALKALGWSAADLAAELRIGRPAIRCWTNGNWEHITIANARRVRDLYERLSMQKPPTGRNANYVRAYAARNGWVPPLAWDDDAIDDPDAEPYRPGEDDDIAYDESKVLRAIRGGAVYEALTRREGAEAVRRLNSQGLNDGEVARILRGKHNTIQQRRIRMGLPANAESGCNYARSA